MMEMPLLRESELPGLKLVKRGKVRDIYELGEDLLIVATDRISAFDVVMDDPIPGKGHVLTTISAFWFEIMEHIIPNHLISTNNGAFPPACQTFWEMLEGRTMLVRKAEPLPVECIVRGYLAGSGWKDYCRTGEVCGQKLPSGLKESARLPDPIFTPSTKAKEGEHDENISFEHMVELIGESLAVRVRNVSLALYEKGLDVAEPKGIIIADTKFEFGILDSDLILIDELLTPDSSRFWPKDQYSPGRSQPSFDKQFLRDYLEGLEWGKTYPPPPLPPEVIAQTAQRYRQAMELLTT
ncbi:MAG: phosphoribosylaminoimidazolesuccinocarboxamide synthase [Pseudomonadota bacterium]